MATPPQINSKLEKRALETSAKVTLNLWQKIQRMWFRWAELNQHSAWFPFFIAFIVGMDAITVILPGDVIVVLAVLSNPKAWKKLALAAGLGGAIGAMILFMIVRSTRQVWIDPVTEYFGWQESWGHAKGFFKEHGLASLALGSLLPGLSLPPVILAGFAKSAILPTAGYLLVGRLLRYLIICFGTREGWAFFQTVRNKAREERDRIMSLPDDAPEKRGAKKVRPKRRSPRSRRARP